MKLKKRALVRAAENADGEDLRRQRARETLAIRNGRIQNLRNALANLKQQQEEGYALLDAKADRAGTYPELCALHVGFAVLRSRMRQIEERTRELMDLDAGLHEQLTVACQTVDQRTSEEICRIQNKLREKILAHKHKEELLALYPDLTPVTPPPTPQCVQPEQPRRGTPGVAAPDWVKYVTTIAKGITRVGPGVQSVKKQDSPKFSGKISDYPRWRKNWREIMKENDLTDDIHKMDNIRPVRSSKPKGNATRVLFHKMDNIRPVRNGGEKR